MFMCSMCKMDPRDVAILRQRQGAVEVDDFYKEVNYTPRKKKTKRVREKRTRPGCPENNNGPHVYIWTTETVGARLYSTYLMHDMFYDYFGYSKWKYEVCAGCLKGRGREHSDRYEKAKERKWNKLPSIDKGEPVSRWARGRRGMVSYRYWNWENEDEVYNQMRRDYINRNGWTRYVYGF